jgi:hypothetical protein
MFAGQSGAGTDVPRRSSSITFAEAARRVEDSREIEICPLGLERIDKVREAFDIGGVERECFMNRSGLATIMALALLPFMGCANGAHPSLYRDKVVVLYQQETGDGYCHKKLEPIGPSDPGRPTDIGNGDYIDYYGPCDGPTLAEMIQAQRQLERQRYTTDYSDP